MKPLSWVKDFGADTPWPSRERGLRLSMNRAIGWALMAGGVVVLIFGIQESNSFSSSVSRTFNGTPTNQSIWMIAVGVVLAIVGLIMGVTGRGTRT
jgi:hypothetical protein